MKSRSQLFGTELARETLAAMPYREVAGLRAHKLLRDALYRRTEFPTTIVYAEPVAGTRLPSSAALQARLLSRIKHCACRSEPKGSQRTLKPVLSTQRPHHPPKQIESKYVAEPRKATEKWLRLYVCMSCHVV